ncbi:hypothetical protein J4216_01435 [Candidatus Woesearchaeota archaeon]|nr:hypothetical protein [Candidatus Woesearchaeota archaeon]
MFNKKVLIVFVSILLLGLIFTIGCVKEKVSSEEAGEPGPVKGDPTIQDQEYFLRELQSETFLKALNELELQYNYDLDLYTFVSRVDPVQSHISYLNSLSGDDDRLDCLVADVKSGNFDTKGLFVLGSDSSFVSQIDSSYQNRDYTGMDAIIYGSSKTATKILYPEFSCDPGSSCSYSVDAGQNPGECFQCVYSRRTDCSVECSILREGPINLRSYDFAKYVICFWP